MNIRLLAASASDLSVVNAARVSFAAQSEDVGKREEGLIRFLMNNHHGSPFEHGYFRFRVEAPIFVLREWQRHRAGHSYNEVSGRYVELGKRFYKPESFRVQKGKPGAYTFEDMGPSSEFSETMDASYESAWHAYERLLEDGVAKEQARAVLPLALYSQMIWSCNPRSLMHFCALRNSSEAMQEIRLLAAEAESCMADYMPVTHKTFVANGRRSP